MRIEAGEEEFSVKIVFTVKQQNAKIAQKITILAGVIEIGAIFQQNHEKKEANCYGKNIKCNDN